MPLGFETPYVSVVLQGLEEFRHDASQGLQRPNLNQGRRAGARAYSPARKVAQGSAGRSRSSAVIHSNCGWASRNFSALKGVPHAEPHRAANAICFAMAASTT